MQGSATIEKNSRPCQQPPGEMNEQETIQRAKNGDAAAFESLYISHSSRVYALCLRMTGNSATAEDLTQEVFLQLFRKIGSFRGDSVLSTWLHRITVNAVLMRMRKKRLPEVSLSGSGAPDEDENQPLEVPSTDASLKGALDRLDLNRAVAELSPGYRETFYLHDVMGYAHDEIAGMLHCSIGNTKSQLHKARLRLQSLLRGGKAQNSGKNPLNKFRLKPARCE